MNWYFQALKKYAVFNDRAEKKEFWYFSLFVVIFSIALAFIDAFIPGFDTFFEIPLPEQLNATYGSTYSTPSGVGLLGGIYALAMAIPSLSIAVRRLHDTDRTGWWLLLVLLPLIGIIVLMVFWAKDSTPGENRYGPDSGAAARD
jgi:uncharacterized membrane protein YhaH (DUF805 family)